MSTWPARRRRRGGQAAAAGSQQPPPVLWGRVGPYEAVTRQGILLLLAPDPVHPALRVRSDA